MSHDLRRRTFLKLLSLASAGVATGCSLASAPDAASRESEVKPGDVPTRSGNGKDVVVIGGGLAGLCSAYELRKKGYNIVAILEAQARTGGRVLTLRDGLANGQYAEAGATRIADTHNYT